MMPHQSISPLSGSRTPRMLSPSTHPQGASSWNASARPRTCDHRSMASRVIGGRWDDRGARGILTCQGDDAETVQRDGATGSSAMLGRSSISDAGTWTTFPFHQTTNGTPLRRASSRARWAARRNAAPTLPISAERGDHCIIGTLLHQSERGRLQTNRRRPRNPPTRDRRL